MTRRSPPSWIDVRRLVTGFILLVVVPTGGLVGFGIVAIDNERAAVEQRFKDQYSDRLHTLAEHLASTLEKTSGRLTDGERGTSPLVKFDFTFTADQVDATPPVPPEVQSALAASLRAFIPPRDGSVALMPIAIGPAHDLYAVRRLPDGTLRGLAFSEEGLTASVAHESKKRFPGELAQFSLEGPHEPATTASSSPLRAMLDAVTSDRIEQGVVDLPLPGALAAWRIVATLPGNDPVRRALLRNRTIYIVTLSIVYVIITIGVIATLRGMWREARLSALKTDFVSNIAHELRTPLTSIRMFAETLRLGRATTPEEQALCIDFIARESERLSLITERTLDWARLEAGRRPFVRERVSPSTLVRTSVDRFLAHGTVDHEAFSVALPEDLPPVDVDAAAIGQVLLNLFENAVKYSGPTKRITVRGRRAGRMVLIEVGDNGIGIARKDLKRVFERFYRADDLLARRTEGSGLGLAIARRIVVAHAGRLAVRSKLGVGSVFTIMLPAATGALTATRSQESPA